MLAASHDVAASLTSRANPRHPHTASVEIFEADAGRRQFLDRRTSSPRYCARAPTLRSHRVGPRFQGR